MSSSTLQKPIVTGLLLATALSLNIFLFAPATIYFGNSAEFVTPIGQLITWWALPAIATLLLVITVGMILPARAYRHYLIVIASLSLLVWLQGNVLAWNYGLLDGRNIDWDARAWRGWVDGSIWVVVIVTGVVFCRRLYRPVLQAVGLLFLVQLVQLGFDGFNHRQQALSTAAGLDQGQTIKPLAAFSPHQNVLHIVLDGFQSDFFDQLIQHPQIGENYRNAFSGFTFYREMLGVFPFTRFAVPAFLSGKIYTNEQSKDEFIRDSIAENSILSAAGAAGMELDLASVEYWSPLYGSAGYENRYVIPEGGHGSAFEFRVANTAKLIDLALFRVAPHFLKKEVYNQQRWLVSPLLMDTEYLQFHYFSHTQFINEIIENMGSSRATPTYKYFHVMNTHNPMVVDSDCHYAGGALQTNRATLLMQSKCTLDTVVKLLDRMKQLGIYESSLIVFHGDHGGWVPHRGYQPQKVNDQQEVPYWAVSLGSPLLIIKPPSASGPMVTSDQLVSLSDLADTIADLLNWPQKFNSQSIFQQQNEGLRTRYFYNYYWQKDAWETDYAGPIQEFEITGKHYESVWFPKRVFDPPG